MTALAISHQDDDVFDIHEDARTEETEMIGHDTRLSDVDQAVLELGDEGQGREEPEADDPDDDESSEEEEVIDGDRVMLQHDFPGLRHKYRLIKRIGEGNSPEKS